MVGCGDDTPLNCNLITYLKGSLDFVDNNPYWETECKRMGADDVHIVSYSHNQTEHLRSLEGAQGVATSLGDPLFALQRIPLPEIGEGRSRSTSREPLQRRLLRDISPTFSCTIRVERTR